MVRKESHNQMCYDVAIVGAGLAGLSSAYHCNGLKTCIIEKEKFIGGRITTRYHDGIAYECGAIFQYDKKQIPFDFTSSSLITENHQIGLYHKGNLFLGDTVLNCIKKCGITEDKWANILRFYIKDKDSSSLKNTESEIINSFFKVIHPGNFQEYIAQRQYDAFINFCSNHYTNGNKELTEEYAKRISATINLGSEVMSVIDKNNIVEITYKDAHACNTINARTAIITTPAPITDNILLHKNDQCREFLSSLKYGRGVVAVLALSGVKLDDFSYIVTTGHPVNTIIKSSTKKDDVTLINAYYTAGNAIRIQSLPENEIITSVLDIINHCSTHIVSPDDIIFTDIHKWDMVGPVISDKSYTEWDNNNRRPSPRVFLAGDYTFVEPHDPMPYGMTSAILSGRHTAADVQDFLK